MYHICTYATKQSSSESLRQIYLAYLLIHINILFLESSGILKYECYSRAGNYSQAAIQDELLKLRNRPKTRYKLTLNKGQHNTEGVF